MNHADNPLAILEKVFEGSQRPLSQESLKKLDLYLELLLEWSQRINLTGFRDEAAAAEGLLYDAVEIAPLVSEGASMLDIGAGAGGLSVALATLRPDLSFRLVEPRTKRMVFLRTVVRELGLASRFELVQERAEALPIELSRDIDVAYAQAVMPPEPWLELAQTLIRPNGLVVCLSTKTLQELNVSIPENLSIELERQYELPLSGKPRAITTLRKKPPAD